MSLRKIIGSLHLWLGLSSGLIVFIVALTGCLYAFQTEIQELTEPYRFVKAQNKPTLLPSQVKAIADKTMPGKTTNAVFYHGPDRAMQAMFYKADAYYDLVFIDPYTGRILKVRDMKHSFFPWILEGHEFLWLPEEIGRPIVASATLVFFVLCCSGLYLWWPRNKAVRRQRFMIKWNARWRRKNYDLHNVLGFYSLTIGILLALTGLLFGFDWFANSAYYAASGGKTMAPYFDAGSDTTQRYAGKIPAVDRIWQHMQRTYPKAQGLQLYLPSSAEGQIDAAANPDIKTYWKTDYHYFDQQTLKEIPSRHIWKKLSEANGGDLLMRAAYDLHTGSLFGLPGKVLVFFGSLIIASLPVTGSILLIGRRKR